MIRQIGKDPEKNSAVGDGLDQRGHAFAHSINQVCSHRVAGINQQCNRLLDLIDNTAKVVRNADARSASVIDDLRHLQGRAAGLDDAIARIGQSIDNLETSFPVMIEKARKSMLMFVFACMALAVVALATAVTSMFV